MKRPLVSLIALLAVGCVILNANAQGPALTVAWELSEGVQSPESAYFDEDSDCVFLSQIGDGGATGKDQDGYLSKLTPDGKVVAIKWVEGLDSPKGLASHQGRLWVSDIDQLIGVDIAQGKIVDRMPLPGATFLNDVACDSDGTVYVSDTMENTIYRCRDGRADVFAKGEMLEYPNGLCVAGNCLVVASWGKPTEDFSTEIPGRLFTLDLKTGEKTLITPEPFGNLDGLEAVAEGRYLVSDWMTGKIHYVVSDGRARDVLQLPKGVADIGYVPGRRLLIVPQMMENKITAYELKRPTRAR